MERNGLNYRDTPSRLLLIAGRGVYPLLLAESAKSQGVGEVVALAFKHETDRAIERYADRVIWISLGHLQRFLDTAGALQISNAVMAGLIRPRHLFFLRLDARMVRLLSRLRQRNAETIFGAVAAELKAIGIDLLPAHRFMEQTMPDPGCLSRITPDARVASDIALGTRVARFSSNLDIGQTVVVKNGTVLAVEAFEGTDRTIARAGQLGGPGAVVVKAAKTGHDMRFDIPVVGERTLKGLRRIGAAALAVEARRTILLEREKLIDMANRFGLCFTAVEIDKEGGDY